jgi:hypothetical protein
MRVRLPLGLVAAVLSIPPAGAEEAHRQLGAHQHGRGELNIAVEGKHLTMELRAPGADIVGFEHKAASAPDKRSMEAARQKLAAGLQLFGLPGAAGCRLTDAKVDLAEGEHEAHEGERASKRGENKVMDANHDHEDGHSEFRVAYSFECAAPAEITSIDFGYFDAFAGAQELDVNIVTEKGQASYEVTRSKPRLSLTGLM